MCVSRCGASSPTRADVNSGVLQRLELVRARSGRRRGRCRRPGRPRSTRLVRSARPSPAGGQAGQRRESVAERCSNSARPRPRPGRASAARGTRRQIRQDLEAATLLEHPDEVGVEPVPPSPSLPSTLAPSAATSADQQRRRARRVQLAVRRAKSWPPRHGPCRQREQRRGGGRRAGHRLLCRRTARRWLFLAASPCRAACRSPRSSGHRDGADLLCGRRFYAIMSRAFCARPWPLVGLTHGLAAGACMRPLASSTMRLALACASANSALAFSIWLLDERPRPP